MRIDLGFSVAGENAKKETYYVHILREDVIKRITDHPSIDPWTKNFLVRRVNDYPDNALVYFVTNINQIVATALTERNRILKEENDRQHKDQYEEESRQSEANYEGEFDSSTGTTGIVEAEKETSEEERESLFSNRASG